MRLQSLISQKTTTTLKKAKVNPIASTIETMASNTAAYDHLRDDSMSDRASKWKKQLLSIRVRTVQLSELFGLLLAQIFFCSTRQQIPVHCPLVLEEIYCYLSVEDMSQKKI